MQSIHGQQHAFPELIAGTLEGESAPGEPVTTAEAKSHLRYTNSDKDTPIAMLVSVARAKVEHMTGRSIIRSPWTLRSPAWWEVDRDGFFTRELRLPRGPVLAVSEVRYRAQADGEFAVLATDQYRFTTLATGRSVFRAAHNITLPALWVGDAPDKVEIDYVAGAAQGTPTAVDQRLRMAVLMLVAFYFERPESTNFDVPDDVMSSLRGLTHELDISE